MSKNQITPDNKTAKNQNPKISKFTQSLKNFWKKHARILIGLALAVFFVITFIISVAGGLRVFFPYYSQLTGFPFGQKHYLVIFQNNNELRPSGGFISSFATVDMTAGFPTKIQIEDVYGDIDEHPYQEGPYPMTKLLANEWYKGYTFRDGNYSPNFPDTAKELIRLYNLTRPNQQFDGVIAVNFRFLEDLLDALGPIQISSDSGEKWLSKDNLFEELTNQVNDVDRHNLASLASRKSILKSLSDAIIKKVLFNPFKLRKVSDIITVDLIKKDLQLYFTNPDLQLLIKKNRWGGAWPEQPAANNKSPLFTDFLAINEANLGGMKSDRYITRNVNYHVRISEEALKKKENPQATLTLELEHFGIENIPLSGPYTGYFRFYNNPNQVKSAFSKSPIPTEENPSGTSSDPTNTTNQQSPQEQIIKLNPGESKQITKQYDLPNTILKDNIYTLFIPKQAGTEADNYTVIIELPRGYRTESDDFSARENLAFWQGPISRDATLSLNIVNDTTPPRLTLQENTQLNKISLHFNEDLNPDYASDPFSYAVTDLNLINPTKTDQIKLTKVITTSKDVDLFLSGQTSQPEERYGVQLKNLRDTHGNILSDRQITVVQRVK